MQTQSGGGGFVIQVGRALSEFPWEIRLGSPGTAESRRKITPYADERSNSKICTGMTSPRSLFWRGQKRAHANHLRLHLPPDTPPVDVCAQGRSPDLRVTASIPAFPERSAPVTQIGTMLAAYSCGGSFGLASPRWRHAPNSRLSSQSLRIGRTSNTTYSI